MLRSFATDSYSNVKLFTFFFSSRLDHLVSGLIEETNIFVKIRFHYAFFYWIKLASSIKLLNHYTKGKIKTLRIVDSRLYAIFIWFFIFLFLVFSSLCRFLFHLSLTVLLRYWTFIYILVSRVVPRFSFKLTIELLFLIIFIFWTGF